MLRLAFALRFCIMFKRFFALLDALLGIVECFVVASILIGSTCSLIMTIDSSAVYDTTYLEDYDSATFAFYYLF